MTVHSDLVEGSTLPAVFRAYLGTPAIGLSLLGFSEEDLDRLLAPLDDEGEGLAGEDVIPEPPVNPVSRPGDLWLLGDHRLLCGDSTKADDVVLYDDLSPDDRLVFFDKTLTGAVRTTGSESPYAYNGDLRMGFNTVGELIIEDKTGRETYIAAAQCGPDVAYTARTAGLSVIEVLIEFARLFAANVPQGWFTDF